MPLESLERRSLFDADPNVVVNLLADADRNGVINQRDNKREDSWSAGRGAIVLPNLDRDNTSTGAPDSWTGGAFNGKAAAPNNVIDNAADLLDVGRFRLNKLQTDISYEYTVVIRLLSPSNDPTWFAGKAATDRVRIFMPTHVNRFGDTVPAAGDVAVIGPGLGSEIRFTSNQKAANDFDINALVGTGAFYFGIEGLTPGATVRIEAELIYQPIGTDGPPPDPVSVGTDTIQLRVAPFVLNDNRQRVRNAIVDDLTPYSLDNSALQKTMKDVFGKSLITGNTGDLWQQDGYEIGYVQAPYGAMSVVLELPRSRDFYLSTTSNERSFIRSKLLRAGVGVSLDLAAEENTGSSGFGGDIESIAKPGSRGPGALLMSGMPQYMKDYFAAQGVNRQIDLPLDWMAVNHVDEVVQMTPGGKVLVADTDLAWALLTWAARLDPNVRLHANMNGNEYIEGNTTADMLATTMLNDARLRQQSLDLAQRADSLRGVVTTLKQQLGLDEELSGVKRTAGTSSIALARGGAFAQLLGDVAREFSIRFDDATNYRLRYRDGKAAWSKWTAGRVDRDEVFGAARAFILKNYWSGSASAGDAFSFRTRPGATLVKMPVLFATSGLLADPNYTPPDPKLVAFSEDHINALVNGNTVITGNPYGPNVKWQSKQPASDLFQGYVTATFTNVGYQRVEYTDARLYHNSSGSVHCGTNAIRTLPEEDWWTA